MSNVTVRSGKTEDKPGTRKITLRGVEYTVRELDVNEYKESLKAVTKEDGSTLFQDLLDVMVLKAVKPSPAAGSKPMSYPVYRTLEDIVNLMHFINLPDESKRDEQNGSDDESAEEGKPDPNS